MANRSIQAKLLKIKRRGRFAVFSGESAKYAVRHEQVVIHETDEKTTVKTIEIAVGEISLSKAVMSTGRGPDAERMAEYYARVRPDSYLETPSNNTPTCDTLRAYDHIIRETPAGNRVRLASDDVAGTLDLFFATGTYFFVEVSLVERVVRRSRDYNNKKTAMDRMASDRIAWVAEIPMR